MNLSILRKTLFVGIVISSLGAYADYGRYKKYLNRGKNYYKEKNYDNAAEFFLKAEKQAYDANSLAAAMVNRGNCLILVKRYELAKKVFKAVISNPQTPTNYKSGAMKALGASLSYQNKYAEAVKILNKCLKQKKLSKGTRQEALWLLGNCYYNTGEFDQAEKVYMQMLKLKKLSPKFKKKVEKKLKEIKEFK
jgi:tetratricopeptide (TPR) repeat protein